MLTLVAALATFAMMLLTTADAFGRYLLNRPILAAYELTTNYLIVAAVFLAMPYAYRQGANIRVTFLVERLRGTVRLAIDYVVQLVSILYCAVLVVATCQQARHMLATKTTFATLDLPIWPGYMVVCVGLFLTSLMMLIDLPEVRKRRSSLFAGRVATMVYRPLPRDGRRAPARGARSRSRWRRRASSASSSSEATGPSSSGSSGTTPFGAVADYVLTTIPMFILMAYFSASSGLARDLYTAGANWLSRVKGGLAIATVFACGIFGAMSGASLAAAAVMSGIAMPEMRRRGYSDELAAGSIGIGATLDILIPPSVGMVIYGITTQTSIGKLLIAGVIPGIIVAIFLTVAILVWVRVQPLARPGDLRRPRGASAGPACGRIWSSLLLIVLVVALLYTGVATPTEVGALGAFLAGVIGVAFGRLTWAGALEAIRQTIKTSALIFTILIGATIFGYYMAMSKIPQQVVAAVTEMNLNRWVVIVGHRDRLLRGQHVHGRAAAACSSRCS